MKKDFLTRRKLLTGGAIMLGGIALTGCDALSASPDFRSFLKTGEGLTMATQRVLMFGQPLAREFSERDISPVFKANGTKNPKTPAYNALAAANFANWRLRIDGLVERPVDLGIADLRVLTANPRAAPWTSSRRPTKRCPFGRALRCSCAAGRCAW